MEGYPTPIKGCDDGHVLVAHGLSTAINAPSVFRFTGTLGAINDLAATAWQQQRKLEDVVVVVVVMEGKHIDGDGSSGDHNLENNNN